MLQVLRDFIKQHNGNKTAGNEKDFREHSGVQENAGKEI